MKKFILSFCFILVSVFPAPGLFADQTVTLGIGEWSPRFSKNLKYYGVTARIVSEAFKINGITVKYVFRPWKRSLGEARNGSIDGSPGWLKNEERLKDFYFSDKIAQNINAFFYLKTTDFDWQTIEDLAGFSIGIVNGYFYGEDIKKAEQGGWLKLFRSPSDEINFKQLINKRVDVILCEFEVAQSILARLYNTEQRSVFTYHPKFSLTEDLYLLLSRKDPKNRELIKTFNKGLKKLLQNGRVEQFFKESRRGDYKK